MTDQHPWTGRLWGPGPTLDGRAIAPGAVSLYPENGDDTPLATEEGGRVGNVDAVVDCAGAGVATGRTILAPGVYAVAMMLGMAEVEITGDINNPDAELAVTTIDGRLTVLTVLTPGREAAWSEAQILVHDTIL